MILQLPDQYEIFVEAVNHGLQPLLVRVEQNCLAKASSFCRVDQLGIVRHRLWRHGFLCGFAKRPPQQYPNDRKKQESPMFGCWGQIKKLWQVHEEGTQRHIEHGKEIIAIEDEDMRLGLSTSSKKNLVLASK